MSLPRRAVVIARKLRKKQRVKLWAFGFAEMAALVGKSEQAVRLDVCRGRVDPSDLGSLLRWVEAQREKQARRSVRGSRG